MTYFSPVISPNMWSLWPLMVDSVQEWAIDYFGSKYFEVVQIGIPWVVIFTVLVLFLLVCYSTTTLM